MRSCLPSLSRSLISPTLRDTHWFTTRRCQLRARRVSQSPHPRRSLTLATIPTPNRTTRNRSQTRTSGSGTPNTTSSVGLAPVEAWLLLRTLWATAMRPKTEVTYTLVASMQHTMASLTIRDLNELKRSIVVLVYISSPRHINQPAHLSAHPSRLTDCRPVMRSALPSRVYSLLDLTATRTHSFIWRMA